MPAYSLALLFVMVLMTTIDSVWGESQTNSELKPGFLRYLEEEETMETCTSEQMSLCGTYSNMTGSCNVFGKGTEGAWCSYEEIKICCAENLDDCCEGDPERLRIIVGFIIGSFAFITAFSCVACECCPMYGCRPKPTKKYSEY